jgi:hypothetical protein
MAESSASAASAAAAAMDLAPSSALMCENRVVIDRDHQVFRAHDCGRVWVLLHSPVHLS